MTNPIHFTTAEEAVKVIKSGDHVHLSSVASAPQCLINAMCKRGEAGELKDVHVHHLHTEGPAPYADPKFEGVFQLDSFFVGANVRKVTQSGYADYIPIFLSETQRLYRCGAVPCNVAMIQVCPPDKHGFVSLGTSVDATLAAVECADYVIAVVNKYVPRAFGQAMIHSSKIDFFVQDDTPLIEAKFSEPNEVETAIGKHCAALIEDGATLQMGIGAIPNAVLSQLGGHKNLGIHTEMFADGRTAYIQAGRTSATGCARLIGKEGLARSEQFRLTVLPDKTGCNRSPVSSRYVQYPILDGYLRRRPGAHMPNIDQIGPMNTDEPIVEPLSPLRNTGPRPVRAFLRMEKNFFIVRLHIENRLDRQHNLTAIGNKRHISLL